MSYQEDLEALQELEFELNCLSGRSLFKNALREHPLVLKVLEYDKTHERGLIVWKQILKRYREGYVEGYSNIHDAEIAALMWILLKTDPQGFDYAAALISLQTDLFWSRGLND